MYPPFLDISRPIHAAMAIYPGNPPVQMTRVTAATAEHSAVTHITLGSHTGTHIDAPSHIDPAGRGTSVYALTSLNGPCEVIEIPNVTTVSAGDLPQTTAPRVLIKTDNAATPSDTFDPNFVALDESAAKTLVERGVELVGIDGPSIKKKSVRDSVHQLLLDAGVVILEGLWLTEAVPGNYTLLCLPLAVDLDGAPVRAVLQAA